MKTEAPDQIINPKELLDRMSQVKGSKIITVVMLTEVQLLKKHRGTKEPCPYQAVTKRTRCKVMIGTEYEKGVNNFQEKNGSERDFVAQAHSYADTDHDEKPVIAKHRTKEQWYMNSRVTEVYETELYADGNLVEKDVVKDYMPIRKPRPEGKSDPRGQWKSVNLFPKCSVEQIKTDGKKR